MTQLSTRAKNFVRRHIRSVWQLELLLYFRNNQRTLSIEQVSSALYMDPKAIEQWSKALSAEGILAKDGNNNFKYGPVSNSDADTIEELAKLYQTRATAVVNFIYSSPVRSYSDAGKKLNPDGE